MSEPAVELSGVRFGWPGGFSLAIEELVLGRGEHAACVGPSGCGKTTLAHLIVGVLTPDAGEVCLAGEAVSSLGERARRALRIARVGMVFQSFALLDHLSALDNILLPYHLAPTLRLTPEVRGRAHDIAGSLGIGGLLRRRPRRLSQGERQRVAIGRALVTRPELLVCDEPTGNLDPARAESVIDLLCAQGDEIDATLLVVTHNHALLPRFGRVIDMAEVVS